MTNDWPDIFRALPSGAGGRAVTALRIVAIVAVACIAASVLQGLIRRFRQRTAQRLDDAEAVKRAETLGRVFRYLVAVVMSLMAGVLVLSEIGIAVNPILGAAGVVGLAVGFGAQSLVKDHFTGFFVLLETTVGRNRWTSRGSWWACAARSRPRAGTTTSWPRTAGPWAATRSRRSWPTAWRSA
jgi:moderate conductance mechanosensitive channel